MSSKTPAFDAEVPDVDRNEQEMDVTPPSFAEGSDENPGNEPSSRTVQEADDGDVVDQAVVVELDDADDYPPAD
ncbi:MULTISPECIES: hypothetical protein [Brevibacterium]|uniref:Uncharacterized protein n=1 Tax=Brevibacterium picturae TaxID=260553 RepID=A0ABP4NBJ2_9MICO|nr:hypothetical protein [Brevibacterium sandarakinum]MDN5585818.1 hypothetical protein [Brevibacterium sp.]MDN5657355.1 hypothetical protein [Brevibacterium sandarakinum]